MPTKKREMTTTYPALPAASDPRWERVLAAPLTPQGLQPVESTNIQRIPTTEGNEPIIVLSSPNVPARIIPEITFADRWTVIDLQGVIGWIQRDYVVFTPFVDNPTVTSTQEMVIPVANQSDMISRAEFEAAINKLKAELRQSLLDDLMAALQKLRDSE